MFAIYLLIKSLRIVKQYSMKSVTFVYRVRGINSVYINVFHFVIDTHYEIILFIF